jgi:hypothetical protein
LSGKSESHGRLEKLPVPKILRRVQIVHTKLESRPERARGFSPFTQLTEVERQLS